MINRAKIKYRDFYDVPRIFLVFYNGLHLLFDCKFDSEADEYPDVYKIYLIPNIPKQVLHGSWENLSAEATRFLGECPVEEVKFDSSKRKSIETKILDGLLKSSIEKNKST